MQDAAGQVAAELRRHGGDFVRLEHLTSVSGGSSRSERRLGAEDVEQPASPISGVEPRAVELRVQRWRCGLAMVCSVAVERWTCAGVAEATKRVSHGTTASRGRTENGLSGRSIQRRPSRTAAGVASGRTWLAPTIPALPAEQPQPSSAPRSSTTTEAPCSASSSAVIAPTTPPPMTATSKAF